jgi:hypothetical protein
MQLFVKHNYDNKSIVGYNKILVLDVSADTSIADIASMLYEKLGKQYRDVSLKDYIQEIAIFPSNVSMMPKNILSFNSKLSDYMSGQRGGYTGYGKILFESNFHGITIVDSGYSEQKAEEEQKIAFESFRKMTKSELTEKLEHYAGCYGNRASDYVRELIALGADVNGMVGDLGRTPIMGATIEHVKLLLKAGANINDSDKSDNTALSLAIMAYDSEVVSYLLEHGASVTNNPKKNEILAFATTYIDGENKVSSDISKEIFKAYSKETAKETVEISAVAAAYGDSQLEHMRIRKVYLDHGLLSGPASVLTWMFTHNTVAHWWIQIKLKSSPKIFVAQFTGIGNDGNKENIGLVLSAHDTQAEADKAGLAEAGRQKDNPSISTGAEIYFDHNFYNWGYRGKRPDIRFTMNDLIREMKDQETNYKLLTNNCQDFSRNILRAFDHKGLLEEDPIYTALDNEALQSCVTGVVGDIVIRSRPK